MHDSEFYQHRRLTAHHQQLIPKSITNTSAQQAKKQATKRQQRKFIAVKVVLRFGTKYEHSNWFQLPKDLQKPASKMSLKQLKDYFIGGLINVPTAAYPNPNISTGIISDVRFDHHYSKQRTRSQFLRYDMTNNVKFLTHDYDWKTKHRIKKSSRSINYELQKWLHPKYTGILDWVTALLIAIILIGLIQNFPILMLSNGFSIGIVSLFIYEFWKLIFRGCDWMATPKRSFRKIYLH